MRIRSLNLTRYGKFTDQLVDLPGTRPDVHLIVGANEAGKSTTRDAITDLLFGIHGRTPYGFIHPYPSLELTGCLEDGDRRICFVRYKRTKGSLCDAAGTPMPDDALASWLGQTDRAFFERMFSLDRADLEAGGNEILSSHDTVGETLFGSAAGIRGLGAIRQRIAEQASAIFSTRKSRDRRFYVAQEAWSAAMTDYKAATGKVRDYKAAYEALEKANQELEQAITEIGDVEAAIERLNRVRRVAPLLYRRQMLLKDLESLKNFCVLPEDAGSRLSVAEAEAAIARHSISALESRVADTQSKLEVLPADSNLVAHRPRIETLAEDRAFVRNHNADIRHQQAEIETLTAQINDDCRELGWPRNDVETLRRTLPGALVRSRLRHLREQHLELTAALQPAKQALDEKEEQIRSEEEALRQKDVPDVPITLRQALGPARRAAQRAQDREKAQLEVAAAESRLGIAMKGLVPWKGTVDALRAMIISDVRVAEETREISRSAKERATNLERDIEETKRKVVQYDGQIGHLRQSRRAVSAVDIDEARQSRDALWEQIVRSDHVDPHANAFNAKVRTADALADDRYAGATESQQLDQALHLREQQESDLEQARTNLAQARQDVYSAAQQWDARMQSLGLQPLQPDEYSTWLAKRTDVLRLADELVNAQRTLQNENQAAEKAAETLAKAVGEAKLKRLDPNLALVDLVEAVDVHVIESDQARVRNEQAGKSLKQAQEQIPALRERWQHVKDGLASWKRDWAEALKQARLAPTTDPTAAEVAIGLMENIQERLKAIHQKQTERIDTMRADLDSFEKSARALATALAPDLTQGSPEEIAAALVQRIETQASLLASRQRTEQEIQDLRRALREAKDKLAEVHAELDPLLKQAGVEQLDQLREKVERSDLRRAREKELATAEEMLRNQSDGLRLERIEAEVEAEDVEGIAQQIALLEQRKRDANARHMAAIRNQQDCQAALKSWGGGDAAATAAERREEAAAEIESAVEDYLRLKISERLLGQGIEAFRQAHQGPMLETSSTLFAKLTRGSFTGLAVDVAATPPILIGKRPSLPPTAVDGMSAGTRDQLYLALRLAAVQLHVKNATALPFIADDLFMTFDDERAIAGFQALAELSLSTQVLYFTHHVHLVDVARRAIGPQLNVVQL
jgi:uncharacterized protein YhaN